MRIQKADVIFVNCTFLNNTASLLGGALFVDRGSTITALNSYFEGISASRQIDVMCKSPLHVTDNHQPKNMWRIGMF